MMQAGRHYKQIIPTCIPFLLPTPGLVKNRVVSLRASQSRRARSINYMGFVEWMGGSVKLEA